MSMDKSSDLLGYVDSEAFRKILREQVLEYEFVNGRKIVSPTYALKMEAVDPKSIIALTEQKENISDLKTHLLNINVKRAILEEIALINGDVTNQSINYLNVVKSFGFEAISNIDDSSTTKNRINSFYHNPLNGSLLIINTEDNLTIYKAILHCQGKISDPEIFKSIKVQSTNLSDNTAQHITIDVTDLLSSKLECLLKSVKFNKNWESVSLKNTNNQQLYDIKQSLGLLNNERPIIEYEHKFEFDKKITHRLKRTLQ